MTYEEANGVSLGAVEPLDPQHYVSSQGTPAISKLAIKLDWFADATSSTRDLDTKLEAPIVRGSPYTSIIYTKATPRIHADRYIRGNVIIDGGVKELVCGQSKGVYSQEPVEVTKEMKITLDTSDMTWLIFVSEPMKFKCSTFDAEKYIQDHHIYSVPGVIPNITSYFDLQAISPVTKGMVRIAMSNNCTTGQNAQCKFEYIY